MKIEVKTGGVDMHGLIGLSHLPLYWSFLGILQYRRETLVFLYIVSTCLFFLWHQVFFSNLVHLRRNQ